MCEKIAAPVGSVLCFERTSLVLCKRWLAISITAQCRSSLTISLFGYTSWEWTGAPNSEPDDGSTSLSPSLSTHYPLEAFSRDPVIPILTSLVLNLGSRLL